MRSTEYPAFTLGDSADGAKCPDGSQQAAERRLYCIATGWTRIAFAIFWAL